MTIPMSSEPEPESEVQRRVDAKMLWAGGAATAVVAAMIALVGILVCRWLFKVPILSPQRDGAWGDASTAGYVFAAIGVALFATAIMHLLLLSTPRPRVFFNWIMGLATVIAVVFPFSTTASVDQKAATALVNLVLGVAIGSLISGVSMRATRHRVVRRGYSEPTSPPSRTPDDGFR
jgi:MFS-type transporter involved in bile tolerance (Atg22 family)